MFLPLLLLGVTPDGLAPLDFLVGHCWRATVAGGHVDTHCFTAGDGEIRDHHEVMRNGGRVYWGDTVYRWDADAAAIRYSYSNMIGGTLAGTVRATATALDFGTSAYIAADGTRTPVTVRWARIGDTAYEVHDVSVSRWPGRVTRYRRID